MDEKTVGQIISGGGTMSVAIIVIVINSLWRAVEFLFNRLLSTEEKEESAKSDRMERLEDDMTALKTKVDDYTPRVAVVESSIKTISESLKELKDLPSLIAVLNSETKHLSNQIEGLRKHGERKN